MIFISREKIERRLQSFYTVKEQVQKWIKARIIIKFKNLGDAAALLQTGFALRYYHYYELDYGVVSMVPELKGSHLHDAMINEYGTHKKEENKNTPYISSHVHEDLHYC
ncbi:hypothetical protein QVD17_21914 [Tagetes erecta]|uniref:Uncharacterized protein n=1 Tax=Tagetes erecta TaxID=13708 RepID=A0AAD8KCX6_TARER|nr:hypothetical protein QVD17_21914 [Tagetes erecta]